MCPKAHINVSEVIINFYEIYEREIKSLAIKRKNL